MFAFAVSFLVSCVRPVRRLVLSVRSSFIACSYCSHLVSWGVSFLISFYRLVLLTRFVLLMCVSPGASRYIPVPPSLRLVMSSCRAVLLARLVFLFIRLIVLQACDEMFLRERATVSSRWACVSFPASCVSFASSFAPCLSAPGA